VEAERAAEGIRSNTRQLRREILELKKQKDNYLTRLKTLVNNHREMIAGFEDDFAQPDREIENLQSRIKDQSSKDTQNRRMSREKITEKFSRKQKKESDVRSDGLQETISSVETESSETMVPIGNVKVDVEIGTSSTENLSEEELREDIAEDIEHSLYPEIDEDSEKEIYGKQSIPEGDSVDKLNGSALENSNSRVDVNEGAVGKDEWTDYEVEKKKADWRDYEISPKNRPDENEVEEALSGLTEGVGPLAEESSASDEQMRKSEGTERKLEDQDIGEQDNNAELENGQEVTEETKEENTWSMDRMRENLTNIGKQDI
jgi:hypothetical protein